MEDETEIPDYEARRAQASETLCVKLGYLLRISRINRGLDIETLAAAVGAKPATIRRLERGDMPSAGLRLIGSVCWALDIKLELTASPLPTTPGDPQHGR